MLKDKKMIHSPGLMEAISTLPIGVTISPITIQVMKIAELSGSRKINGTISDATGGVTSSAEMTISLIIQSTRSFDFSETSNKGVNRNSIKTKLFCKSLFNQ